MQTRASGLLLHPTSLPGRFGIGDLGPEAYRFVDFLHAAGQSLWQILPLGPTGFGDSPYQSFSAFAGNPLLISPELLAWDSLLDEKMLEQAPAFPEHKVDYPAVERWKHTILRQAAARFFLQKPSPLFGEFEAWCQQEAGWLEDFALFMALKEAHNGAPWTDWDPALARRQPAALQRARQDLQGAIRLHQFIQFAFFHQWQALRDDAHAHGVRIIGDVPIFVAHNSADVWAHPELFSLDDAGQPTVVAGVPPDYFSPTGQRWGNPLYRWERMAQDHYAWWVQRMRKTMELVDIVRIDHFRGFEAYWEVPAEEPTAIHGRWVPGPGLAFFRALEAELGPLPIIAEDLGIITPAVEQLRDACGFPGMKVLQFAFGSGPDNPYLPHNYTTPRCVVYTGTHDNDTTAGWFAQLPPEERAYVCRYLDSDGTEIHWDMIRLAMLSIAAIAMVPAQDVLGFGSEARMNLPGRPHGNWAWRCPAEALTDAIAERLRQLALDYGRCAPAGGEKAVGEMR
ncbi:MAG: 4-alpha-glucanotransferase [Anaerolineae bacterium]